MAKTGQIAPQGTVEQWEHWDGSVDAVVKLAPFRIRIRPDRGDTPILVAALEAAVRAHENSLRTGNRWEQAQAAGAVAAARKALEG